MSSRHQHKKLLGFLGRRIQMVRDHCYPRCLKNHQELICFHFLKFIIHYFAKVELLYLLEELTAVDIEHHQHLLRNQSNRNVCFDKLEATKLNPEIWSPLVVQGCQRYAEPLLYFFVTVAKC